MPVKIPFTGKSEFLRIFLTAIFLSVVILFVSASNVSANTVNKNIGGYTLRYVNGQLVPAGGITVLLKIENAGLAGSTTESMVLSSDANGHYGPISKDFYCDEGYMSVEVTGILDNGQTEGGGGYSAAQLPCTDTQDWSDRFGVIIQGDARNNPQNAGDTCPLQSVAEPVNVTNGNMWFKQTDYNLPGKGLPINITRTYNSMVKRSGIFGLGWSTDLDQEITGSAATINLISGNGQTVFFTYAGNNTYLPVTGNFNAQLVATPNVSGMYTVTYRDGRVHHFVNYRLAWMKDRNGNQTTLGYNQYNQLTSVTDASGRTLTFTVNTSNGLIEQASDSTGVIATYEYNIGYVNTLKTVTYADGSKYKFEYDTSVWGRYPLTTVKDANDNILETHQYDSEGRAFTSEKHGGVEKYTLDYSHVLDTVPYTTVTDVLGRATKYTIDKTKGRNVVTKTEGNCSCGGGSEVTTYEYDDKLNLKKKIDALNRQTTYTYNATGDPLTMTDVWGTSAFTYNTFGQVLTFTDRMNGTWTNTYDTNGNLKTTTDALGYVTTVEYPATNNKGLPDSIKDARNKITKFKWFANSGLLEEVEDANGKKTNFTYDGRGRTKTVTNALTHTTTYNYFDDAQRKIEKIYPNADKITYKYDVRRLLESVTDERGKITNYEYDSAYRLKKITDPLGHIKEFDYDLMSNLKWTKDALGNQTDFIYDDYNRLKEVQYPLAETGATRLVEKFEYDAIGRIKKFYDTANRLTTYAYDDTNRINTVTNAELEVMTTKYDRRFQTTEVKDALNQIYNFTYDALGQQLTQTRAGGVMSYEYDAVRNQTKRTDYIGRVTNYEYDDLNRLKKILYAGTLLEATYTYDDISRLKTATNENGTVSFNYDNLDRVKDVTDVFGHLLEYEYDLTSTVNQKRLKFDGSMYAVYNFDDANRMSSVVNSSDNTTISFGYDNADRLTSKTLPNGISTAYDYDGMSRLKRLKDASSSATLFDRQYSYNSASQISQIAESANTRTIGYDLVDRLTSVTASNNQNENYTFDDVGNRAASHLSTSYGYQTGQFNRLASTASANYTYDANGNMLTKNAGVNSWQYTWDYENRMTSATVGSQTVTYKYDALGRRIRRTLPSSIEDTKYIYDGQDVLVDDNFGTLTKYLNGSGIDNKLKVSLNGAAKYFLADHLGSTNGLTDASGNLTESASYDSFGNASGNLGTRYQFTGREFDDFTGLHYYRARFYDSQIGRFISEDPIGFAGGDINLYGYVWNKPNTLIDPEGLAPNQKGATDPIYVKTFLDLNPSLEKLRNASGGNSYRYFYTENYGWVDIRHFAESSRMTHEFCNGEIVRFLGFGNEILQWLTEWGDDYRSGFSPEDLPSNAAGIDFGKYLNSTDKNLGSAFQDWSTRNGARDKSDPKSEFNQLPLIDPSEKGGATRDWSNPTSTGVNGRPVYEVKETIPPYIYF